MTTGWARLPWFDGFAALAAGALMLWLKEPLAAVYGLPLPAFTAVAWTNVAYSALGLSLGARRRRRRAHLAVLIAANVAWAAVCLALALRFADEATRFGLLHLLFEGAFVATLATLEWRYRGAILAPQTGSEAHLAP